MATYRNDHEAALHRSAALKEQLEAAQEELAEKERALAATRAELQRRSDQDDAREALGTKHEEAERQLEKLSQAANQDPILGPTTEPPARPQASERSHAWKQRRRMLRSVVFGGPMWLSLYPLMLIGPVELLALQLTYAAQNGFDLSSAIYKPVLIGIPALILFGPLTYAFVRLFFLRRWAETRPYSLDGYPELLRETPPARDGGRLSVEFEFISRVPQDLESILAGFDPELRPTDTAANSPQFSCPYPVTIRTSKLGSRRDNADTNWEVHRWVQRFEREVLAPLHQVHPIRRLGLQNLPLVFRHSEGAGTASTVSQCSTNLPSTTRKRS